MGGYEGMLSAAKVSNIRQEEIWGGGVAGKQ